MEPINDFDKLCKATLAPAASSGKWLKIEEVSHEAAARCRAFDWCVAVYRDESFPLGFGVLELVPLRKEDGEARCISIPCESRAAALKLGALIRALRH
jgi:hypothetical protein